MSSLEMQNVLSSRVSDRSVMMIIVQPLYQLISPEQDSDHQFDQEKNCTKVDCINFNSNCGNSLLDYLAEVFWSVSVSVP